MSNLVPISAPSAGAAAVDATHQSDRTEFQRHIQHEDLLVDFNSVEFLPQRRIGIAEAHFAGLLVGDLSVVLDPEDGLESVRHCDSANSEKTKKLRSILLKMLVERISSRVSVCLVP